jgi:DNA-binding CsgD family transcriptional regulator
MTAPVTVSEKDLRTLLGIVQDTRDDLPDAGLPISLLAELTDQIRCDNLSLLDACGVPEEIPPWSWMQEIPPIDVSGIDEMATEGSNWREFCWYPACSGDLRSATRLSDFYSARQWHSTIAYTDAFRHLGIGEHVLQLCLPGPLGPAGWPRGGAQMLIFRGPGPDFSERDRDLLTLLQPHLNQAYLDAERRRHSPPPLTPRQRELMRLIAAGHTNAKIARQLGITEGTVRSHLQDIYTRLQVSNRAAAVARAFPAGAPLQPQR